MATSALTMRILSNLDQLEKGSESGSPIHHEVFHPTGTFTDSWRLFWKSRQFNVVLVDIAPRFLFWYCLFAHLVPVRRPKLVSVDLLLTAPKGFRQKLFARFRRWLLKEVDLFVHYFKDLEGYGRYFGITESRSTYVPFKVNQLEKLPAEESLTSDGDYVLTSGRSQRDFATFTQAMRQTGLPGVLLYHDPTMMTEHGTWLTQLDLPENVRPVEDDGTFESFVQQLRGAKVVVIPLQPDCIRAIGISMYLVAMALKKCVVITDGPATRGIITDQAIVVPPADSSALGDAIQLAWDDAQLRDMVATAARQYAVSLGGEERLYRDLIAACRSAVNGNRTTK